MFTRRFIHSSRKSHTIQISGSNYRYIRGCRVPDNPPCTCTECAQQYRTVEEQEKDWPWTYAYKSAFSNELADEVCTQLVESIKNDREFLQGEMKLRRSEIARRWMNETPESREGLLKSASPHLYQRKWHEPNIWYEQRYLDTGYIFESRKHQYIHLVPGLSLDNLKEDASRLIKLLQLRTEHSPAELATSDNRRLSFGWRGGIVENHYNECAIALHGPEYGSLVPWVHDEVHRGDSIGFPRGLLILMAQSHILGLLRGVVEDLMKIPENEGPTTLITPDFVYKSSLGESTMYIDEAFSNCPAFDLAKLANISNDRLNSAKDHLFDLQTDPAYMRRYVQLIRTSGYSASTLSEGVTLALTSRDLDFEEWTVRHWAWIRLEISELKILYDKFSDQINRGQNLPPEYGNKLASFEALVLHLLALQSRNISHAYPFRPGFQRNHAVSSVKTSLEDGRVKETISHRFKDYSDDPRERRIPGSELFVKDPLDWSINMLATGPNALRSGVLDKFRWLEFLDQHLSNASKEERERIDETLLRKISDLAALNELLELTRSHRPRAFIRDMAGFRDAEQGLAWRFIGPRIRSAEIDDASKVMARVRTLEEIPLSIGAGQALKTFMDSEPPIDLSDHDRWINERQTLRMYWDRFRKKHQKRLKRAGISHIDIEVDLKLSVDSDIDSFMEKFKAEKEKFLASTKAIPPPEKDDVPHLPQTEWGITPEVENPVGELKVKTKTRGEASSINEELANPNTANPGDGQQLAEKVPVKRSAFNVFSSLFEKGGSESVPWQDFVNAMAKVGFMSRSSGGSAVTFEPIPGSKWYEQGTIVVHRPHPVSSLDPVMLRSIGKRMTKWFGWSSETFELDK
ncbi:hypothetical protein LSUE1_G004513 [Lachnellula suecica]|uniref:Uncharacterized protein n=1 Tax=Lachnellula suecica TaxID=602035 RepID=A0A8T9CAB0_9HELO|nr:hypothetical protein LSUE1_G004513 [Lachnellula suecica]